MRQKFSQQVDRISRGSMLPLLCLILLLIAVPTLASSGGSFDLSWYTIDGGGETGSGGSYAISGTAGQPDAGPTLSGGSYTLTGGFWVGAAAFGGGPTAYDIYLPLILQQ